MVRRHLSATARELVEIKPRPPSRPCFGVGDVKVNMIRVKSAALYFGNLRLPAQTL